MATIKRLWEDEAGAAYTMEIILVATLLVIGLVVGLATLRDSVVNKLGDVAGAVDDIVQTYSWDGITGHSSFVAGSDYLDQPDFCDDNDDTAGVADQCIVHGVVSPNQEGQ